MFITLVDKMITLTIDDRREPTKLIIVNGSKTMKRKGKSVKTLLKYVFDNTKKEKVRNSIMELQMVHKFMVKSKTVIEIGD